jgi:hypothetical protein
MATEDPPSGAPVPGGGPPAVPFSPPPAQAPGTPPPPQTPAGSAGEAAEASPRPVAEINLVDRPELDLPEAFGQTVTAGKKAADAAVGGGAFNEAPFEAFEERSYDPDSSRDGTRQTITLWLIGLLCAIVGLTFVALFARGASTGFTDKDFFHELKQVLDVLVGPVITLLASAVGFYFGYKQGELGDQARNNKPPTA